MSKSILVIAAVMAMGVGVSGCSAGGGIPGGRLSSTSSSSSSSSSSAASSATPSPSERVSMPGTVENGFFVADAFTLPVPKGYTVQTPSSGDPAPPAGTVVIGTFVGRVTQGFKTNLTIFELSGPGVTAESTVREAQKKAKANPASIPGIEEPPARDAVVGKVSGWSYYSALKFSSLNIAQVKIAIDKNEKVYLFAFNFPTKFSEKDIDYFADSILPSIAWKG